MEVLSYLPAVIAQLGATMTTDEISHHRIWHSSPATKSISFEKALGADPRSPANWGIATPAGPM